MFFSPHLDKLTYAQILAMDESKITQGYELGMRDPTYHLNADLVPIEIIIGYNNAMVDFHKKPIQAYQVRVAREAVKTKIV